MGHRHMIRALVLVGCCALTAGEALATAQAPDVIFLDAKQYPLLVNPLNEYLAKNPKLRPRSEVTSSANWRGYIAHFAIVGAELHVVDVRIRAQEDRQYRSVFSQVFPVMRTVRATWFTGHLIIADGKRTRYVHSGYASEYERYIVIRVEAGRAGALRRVSHQEFEDFKRSQFDAWKQTEEYRQHVAKGMSDPRRVEKFLFHSATADYLVRIFD